MEKIAVIDIGSNSARMVLVNVLEGGHFVVFDELKETVRLGQDMDWDGFIKPQRIAETIKTLSMFRRLCDANHIEKIFAYATAAVRRAKNSKGLLDEVAMVCGIKVKVLSEEEQCQFIYQGVVNSVDIPKGLIMEMGGSSTNLIYYNRKNIVHYASLPFGAVTLTDMFKGQSEGPKERAEKMEEYVTGELSKVTWLNQIEGETQFIGVGGAFRNLGRISRMIKKYNFSQTHGYEVTVDEFERIYEKIKTLDLDSTMKIKGLSSGRADIFPTALAITKSVLAKLTYEKICISGCGLREGVMFRYACPQIAEKPLQDVLGHSIETQCLYYDINTAHAQHVYDLSMSLYTQLKVIHKLPKNYMKVLRVAAYLHDAGMKIKYYNHHLHSCYMILNSNIFGISHRELICAAFVAAGHRKGSDIDMTELGKYKDIITAEDVQAIKKLAVILRVSESFDRSMSGVVSGVSCEVLGDSVIIKVESDKVAGCTLEIKDALTASSEFLSAYGKHLEIL